MQQMQEGASYLCQLAIWRPRHPQGQQDMHSHTTQLSTVCGAEFGAPCQQRWCSFGSGEIVMRHAAAKDYGSSLDRQPALPRAHLHMSPQDLIKYSDDLLP